MRVPDQFQCPQCSDVVFTVNKTPEGTWTLSCVICGQKSSIGKLMFQNSQVRKAFKLK